MLRVRTFGECAIEIGERRIAPDAEIVFAILLSLSFELGAKIPRERLRRLLWPGLSEKRELQCLRQALYKVRQYPGIPIDISPTHVSLRREAVETDFAALLEPGWQKLFLNLAPPAGEFLPGYTPTFSEPFAEWIVNQRDLVDSRVRLALAAAIAEQRAAGAWGTVAELARRCLQVDPLNENATLALAESIAMAGKRSDAIAVLDDYLIEVGPTQLAQPASTLRQRIAERLSTEPYLRTSEGIFVGRDDSMRLLSECTRRTRTGFSTSAFVWGEPGIGKSRLVDEFCRGAILDGTVVQRISCQASDAERPLSVFVDLVPHLIALPGALGCAPESLSHLRRLTAHGGNAMDGGGAKNADDAEAIASGIRRAIYDLLDASSSEARLLIAVEDVHWADPASLKLFGDVVTWCDSRQLQFLLTSRTPPALGSRATTELSDRLIVHRLGSLDARAATELLRSLALARGRSAEEGFVEWAVRVAEGNPFFLRELLGRWLETGELHSVPPTLGSLLLSRVAALQRRELRLLQACAVLRRHGRLDRLQTLLGYGNLDVIEALESLGAAGLVVVDGEHSECRHELIVDAALQQLSGATRQALYRLAAEMLEKEAQESTGMALLWDCARLWHQSGDAERAVESATAFARRLTQLGFASDAARLLQQSLSLCANDLQSRHVYSALATASRMANQWQALTRVLPAKRALSAKDIPSAHSHDDDELLLLEALWRVEGEPNTRLQQAEACLACDQASPTHRVAAAELALNVADNMFLATKAGAIFHTAQAIVEGSGLGRNASARLELMYHTNYGDLGLAVRAADDQLRHAREIGSPMELARALRFASWAYRRDGKQQAAIGALNESLILAHRYQIKSAFVSALVFLADTHLDLQDYDNCARWYEQAVAAVRDAEDMHLSLDLIGIGVHLAVARNEPSQALQLANGLSEAIRSDAVQRRKTYALAVWVLAHASAGRPVSAKDLTALHEIHLSSRSYGAQDSTATALCAALLTTGQSSLACELWHEYTFHFRRETWSVPTHHLISPLTTMSVRCAVCAPMDHSIQANNATS